jgi:hypothetical protein
MKTSTFGISLMTIALLSLTISACNSAYNPVYNNEASISKVTVPQKPTAPKLNRVEQAVNDAISAKDFRLYGFSGRRTTLPGLESKNIKEIKKRCGIRILSGTGDVLKNSQDHENRRVNYQFAAKVNEQLYALCLKSS